MEITVTQFIRPNGRKKELTLTLPNSCQAQYDLIVECGCFGTCEQLTTGQAIQYITDVDGDFDSIITPCGIAANKALIELIMRFDKDKFDEWRKKMNAENTAKAISLKGYE